MQWDRIKVTPRANKHGATIYHMAMCHQDFKPIQSGRVRITHIHPTEQCRTHNRNSETVGGVIKSLALNGPTAQRSRCALV